MGPTVRGACAFRERFNHTRVHAKWPENHNWERVVAQRYAAEKASFAQVTSSA